MTHHLLFIGAHSIPLLAGAALALRLHPLMEVNEGGEVIATANLHVGHRTVPICQCQQMFKGLENDGS